MRTLVEATQRFECLVRGLLLKASHLEKPGWIVTIHMPNRHISLELDNVECRATDSSCSSIESWIFWFWDTRSIGPTSAQQNDIIWILSKSRQDKKRHTLSNSAKVSGDCVHVTDMFHNINKHSAKRGLVLRLSCVTISCLMTGAFSCGLSSSLCMDMCFAGDVSADFPLPNQCLQPS